MARINTNMASEFWFYSQLHRLGYESYITLGNTKAIDIVVILHDKKKTRLTFDVKGKETFKGGTYQYLPKKKIKNHFYVLIGLQIKKNKNSKKIELFDTVECYIIESKNLHFVASKWKARSSKAHGYGLDQRFLRYIKSNGTTKLSKKSLNYILKSHNIKEVNFRKYNEIIMSLEDFETKYYRKK